MKSTSKNQSSTRIDTSYAKKFTDYVAEQFAVTKQIKARDKANTKAGKDAK